MQSIREGSCNLGLLINVDETWCSTNFYIYEKYPLFKGRILCPESKRVARVGCLFNDMIINVSNTISSIGATALTIDQHFPSYRRSKVDKIGSKKLILLLFTSFSSIINEIHLINWVNYIGELKLKVFSDDQIVEKDRAIHVVHLNGHCEAVKTKEIVDIMYYNMKRKDSEKIISNCPACQKSMGLIMVQKIKPIITQKPRE
ncbi:hypothetical protein A3Q56_04281 [Intoshia linei]|uniref:RdRp catalytic domain-containing protein n=1 Tax=Intoshia linei TaxID=1819745 RepID=A0A177B304_9BILA|nr:hypothetical protein A3Q56_04281 [Intoshia linei]